MGRMMPLAASAAAILCFDASATQVWYYPLSELPPGWTAQSPWTFSEAGAHVHLGYTARGVDSSPLATAVIETEMFVLPPETQETILEFYHEWEVDGWYASGEYYAHVKVSLSVNDDTPVSILRYYVHGGFDRGFDEPVASGTETFSTELSVSAGDTLRFFMEAYGYAYPSGQAGYTIDWLMSDFVLTAGDGQGMTRRTWADIKTDPF